MVHIQGSPIQHYGTLQKTLCGIEPGTPVLESSPGNLPICFTCQELSKLSKPMKKEFGKGKR